MSVHLRALAPAPLFLPLQSPPGEALGAQGALRDSNLGGKWEENVPQPQNLAGRLPAQDWGFYQCSLLVTGPDGMLSTTRHLVRLNSKCLA